MCIDGGAGVQGGAADDPPGGLRGTWCSTPGPHQNAILLEGDLPVSGKTNIVNYSNIKTKIVMQIAGISILRNLMGFPNKRPSFLKDTNSDMKLFITRLFQSRFLVYYKEILTNMPLFDLLILVTRSF